MTVVSEVKKVSKSKWFFLVAGILLGGTVLAGLVAAIMSKVKSIKSGVANAAQSATLPK